MTYAQLPPVSRAESDFKEGETHNPYVEGTQEWHEYEETAERLLMEVTYELI